MSFHVVVIFLCLFCYCSYFFSDVDSLKKSKIDSSLYFYSIFICRVYKNETSAAAPAPAAIIIIWLTCMSLAI